MNITIVSMAITFNPVPGIYLRVQIRPRSLGLRPCTMPFVIFAGMSSREYTAILRRLIFLRVCISLWLTAASTRRPFPMALLCTYLHRHYVSRADVHSGVNPTAKP
jgi:hypothetical protein